MTDTDNLWAKLFSVERPSIDIDFPANVGQEDKFPKMKVIELTAEEASVCEMSADKAISKLFGNELDRNSESYKSLYNKHNAANIIYRCCRNVNDDKVKIFPSPESVFKALSVDQMGVIMNSYYELMATKGCIKAVSDPDELELMITRLMIDGSDGRFLLNSCASEMLKDLVMYTVSQLQSLRTDNNSAISPPKDM